MLSIDEAIDVFRLKIRKGPDFVCTVCHRMMYRLGVLPYNRLIYTKASNNLFFPMSMFGFMVGIGMPNL